MLQVGGVRREASPPVNEEVTVPESKNEQKTEATRPPSESFDLMTGEGNAGVAEGSAVPSMP